MTKSIKLKMIIFFSIGESSFSVVDFVKEKVPNEEHLKGKLLGLGWYIKEKASPLTEIYEGKKSSAHRFTLFVS